MRRGIIIVSFLVLAGGHALAATHTVSALACKPYGNPSISWNDLSYTSFGPANHSGTAERTLGCPVTRLPSQTTSAPTYYFDGYDRDPSDELFVWFCAYQPDGNGAVCENVGSGVTYVGPYSGALLSSSPIPSAAYFVVWPTIPKIWVGQLSHATSMGVGQ